MTKTKAFGIFEGGGAKGLAHAGALKAAEERFTFIGVAGTSAGAIVASLIAAGFRADEIYSPKNETGILNKDLTELLEPREWGSLKSIRDRASKRDRRIGWRRVRNACPSLPTLVFAMPLLLLLTAVAGAALSLFLGLILICIACVLLGAFFGFMLYSKTVRSNMCVVLQLGYRWIAIHLFALRHFRPLWSIGNRGGVMTTSLFEEWLNTQLRRKLSETNPDFADDGIKKTVTFADLPIRLKIIAADAEKKEIKVFQAPGDSTIGVAEAVSASISIPLAFVPKSLRGRTYVDGGIMSNFPAWVFDREREETPRFTPTIGFRLVETREGLAETSEQFDFIRHLKDVGYSAVFGDNTLETRNVAELNELMIGVKIGVLDFDVDDKDAVYDSAFRQAKERLEGLVCRVSNENMKKILGMVDSAVRQDMKHMGHLRINVMLPIDNSRLQVAYCYNMDEEQDTDDRLTLGKHQGASGDCWTNLSHVVCDLEEAKSTYSDVWKMDKYQQRLVRDSLKSLLSVPLFLPDAPSLQEGFVGVLNFDSEEDLTDQFRELVERGDEGKLIISTQLLVGRLTNWRLV